MKYGKNNLKQTKTNLNGLTSNPTILESSVVSSLWYLTKNVKWLWIKTFSSLLCNIYIFK